MLDDTAITLIIIGKDWLESSDPQGKPRLQDPNDFVRVEVEMALNNDEILVIPVLVGEATMPAPDDLPESLRELCFRNMVQVRHDPDFHRDITKLISAIEASQSTGT